MKFHIEDAAPRGTTLIDKRVPSNLAVKTPLIVCLSSELAKRELLPDGERERVEACFEEVITNAIVHGNGADPERSLHVRLFEEETCWGVEVTDEGGGFSPDEVPDPDDPDFPWMEHGRGIHMMKLIADCVDFYSGGRTAVLTWRRRPVVVDDVAAPPEVTETL